MKCKQIKFLILIQKNINKNQFRPKNKRKSEYENAINFNRVIYIFSWQCLQILNIYTMKLIIICEIWTGYTFSLLFFIFKLFFFYFNFNFGHDPIIWEVWFIYIIEQI